MGISSGLKGSPVLSSKGYSAPRTRESISGVGVEALCALASAVVSLTLTELTGSKDAKPKPRASLASKSGFEPETQVLNQNCLTGGDASSRTPFPVKRLKPNQATAASKTTEAIGGRRTTSTTPTIRSTAAQRGLTRALNILTPNSSQPRAKRENDAIKPKFSHPVFS
jgi:hypothetical protein